MKTAQLKKEPPADINQSMDISVVEVAKIAACIQTPGLSASQKVAEALEILRVAIYWHQEALKEGISAPNLSYYRRHGGSPDEQEHPLHAEAIDKFLKVDDELNFLPMTYKSGLLAIIPEAKPPQREERFTRFLKSEGKLSKLVGYKNSGFPWQDFELLYVRYRLWWAVEKSGVKSRARKGKGKQGQVLRRNDKRKGARTPDISKIF